MADQQLNKALEEYFRTYGEILFGMDKKIEQMQEQIDQLSLQVKEHQRSLQCLEDAKRKLVLLTYTAVAAIVISLVTIFLK